MKTTGQRIEERRLALGLRKTDVYKAAKRSSGMYSQWLSGSEPEASALIKIAELLKVTPKSLSTGQNWPEEISETNKPTGKDDGYTINQYHDVRGAMGHGVILQDQPGQITSWRVTAEWLAKNVPANTGKENLAIVTGFGDSMRGMYNSGDPLIVDTGIKSVEFDGVYFFRVGDDGFIKRLQRIPGNGIRVISKNTDYETWTITPDMDFEVFGRVLKVWKSEEF